MAALSAWRLCALLLIPGPSVLYIVFQSAEQGRRVGLGLRSAGIHLGTLVHVAAASAGLSALIVASSLAFSVVKYAGACVPSISAVRQAARARCGDAGRASA